MLALLLLGTGLMGLMVIDGFGDDTESEEGETLEFDGSETLTGTEGDDTLASDQDDALAPETIELLGGNDSAEVSTLGIDIYGGAGDDILTSTAQWGSLNGGDGNDTLTASNQGVVLYGGDGDDILSGVDTNALYGGDGDDTLILDGATPVAEDSEIADGGAGDDTFYITETVGDDWPLNNNTAIVGGEGNDSFNVELLLENGVSDYDEDGEVHSDTVSFVDFDPDEDSLVIELTPEEGAEDRDTTLTFSYDTDEDGTVTTTLNFAFSATEDSVASTAEMVIKSDVEITANDITLVGF